MLLAPFTSMANAAPVISNQGFTNSNLDLAVLSQDHYVTHNGNDIFLRSTSTGQILQSLNCSSWNTEVEKNPFTVSKDRTVILCGNKRLLYQNQTLITDDLDDYSIKVRMATYSTSSYKSHYIVPNMNGTYADITNPYCYTTSSTFDTEIQLNTTNGTMVSKVKVRLPTTNSGIKIFSTEVLEEPENHVRLYIRQSSQSMSTGGARITICQGGAMPYSNVNYVDINMTNTTANGDLGTITLSSSSLNSFWIVASVVPGQSCNYQSQGTIASSQPRLMKKQFEGSVYNLGYANSQYGSGICKNYYMHMKEDGTIIQFPSDMQITFAEPEYTLSPLCTMQDTTSGFMLNGTEISSGSPTSMDCLDDESAILSVNGRHYSYWEDSDGDGYNDLIDPFKTDSSQWSDIDGDGYGDNPAPANQPDQCPFQAGTAWRNGKAGCPDADNDGFADSDDEFPQDVTQWSDSDGDLLGDNWGNPQWNSSRKSYWPGEFVTNAKNSDPSPFDFDNDGFEDSTSLVPEAPWWAIYYLDDCPVIYGLSNGSGLLKGCPDQDGDGFADSEDDFPTEITQWSDYDEDGYGDNYGNSSWNSTRDPNWPGIYVPGAKQQDGCPWWGYSTWTTSYLDVYGCQDLDGDGYSSLTDVFDYDPFEVTDVDEDGIGDNGDVCPYVYGEMNLSTTTPGCPDTDYDGVTDSEDRFPFDGDESQDSDNDGKGDNWDDLFPLNPREWKDSDRDCVGWLNGTYYNDSPTDEDGDGCGDNSDHFPNNPLEQKDSDGDGFGDNSDAFPLNRGEWADKDDDCNGTFEPDNPTPLDGEGCGDNSDQFPNNPTETSDSDGDGIGDNSDGCISDKGPYSSVPPGCPDADGDGTPDHLDEFVNDRLEQKDSDSDEIGDNSDYCPDEYGTSDKDFFGCPDSDGDGYADIFDDWPADPSAWSDADNDTFPDQLGNSNSDDCPSRYGLSTIGMRGCADLDGDGIPDLIDGDIDQDGYLNAIEEIYGTDSYDANSTPDDFDNDKIPDKEDEDSDGDGFPNELEIERDTDPLDPNDTPLTQAPGFYLSFNDGISFSSEYDEDGFELSLLRLRDEIKTVGLTILSIIFSIMTLKRKTRRYNRIKDRLEDTDELVELDEIREEIDEIVEKGKIKPEQGLLLRNLFEQKEKMMLGLIGDLNESLDDGLKEIPVIESNDDTAIQNSEDEDQIPDIKIEGVMGDDGYEYHTDPDGKVFYRLPNTDSPWLKFER